MADKKPLTLLATGELSQFQTGDTVAVTNGGTGATTPAQARTNLGVAVGTDVQAYDSTLAALAIFNSNGLITQTSVDTFVARAVTGTATRIVVTNGDGVAGAPTIDLATLADGGGGTFSKFTRDSYGRISGSSAVVATDISGLVDTRYLQLSGGTLTNFLSLHADPTGPLHAVTKQYVDGVSGGMDWKASVKVASTVAGTIATSFAAGQIVDGITLVLADRILIKNQAAGTENGIYTVTAGAPTRTADADSSADVTGGLTVWVEQGTTNGDTGWTLTNDGAIVIGTTAWVFTQSSGLGQVVAGGGLTKTGNQLDIGTASATRIVVNADTIDLATSGVVAGTYTKITVDTYGRATVGATAVPADVGAQAADATLTALAAFNTNGLLVQTAADTFAGRTLVAGGASTITVTNGNGVAGNPSVELTGAIVTPGTYTSVTVDTYGRVTAGSSAQGANLGVTMQNSTGLALAKFKAVYKTATANEVALALASASATMRAFGLTSAAITSGAAGVVTTNGTLTGTTGEWDVVTGQTGGLTPGAVYYLSTTTAGNLVTTVPTTGWLVRMGLAMSSTQLLLDKGEPVQF